MAIAFDTTAGSPSPTRGATSETWSYTMGSVSNGYLTVGILRNDDTTTAADDVTGVTYAGVAMAQLVKVNTSTQEPGVLYIYGLVNPTSGSNNIIISLTGSTGSRVYSVASSYSGVGSTGQPDSSNTKTQAGATTMAISTTTVVNNSWAVGIFGVNSGGGVQTAGLNTTLRTAQANGNNVAIYDGNAAVTPAGSTTLNAVYTGTNLRGALIVSISPFVAATVNSNFLAFM